MSRRVQIVLPDPVADQLYEFAAGADTPPSTLAAQMVRNGVAQAAKDGKVRPMKSVPVVVLEFRSYPAAILSVWAGFVVSRWLGVWGVTGGYWAAMTARRRLESMSW
jgi:hypothetical protein